MATIINFKDRAATLKRTPRATGENGPKGLILLYTGVRYERLATEVRPGAAGTQSAINR